MSTSNPDIPVTFVPLTQSKPSMRGFITNETRGLPVYEAVYKERHEAPVSLGLFVTREAAREACQDAPGESTFIDLTCGELVVVERLLQGS